MFTFESKRLARTNVVNSGVFRGSILETPLSSSFVIGLAKIMLNPGFFSEDE